MAKKIVELDEEEYLRLSKLNQVYSTIMSHPDASVQLEKAAKLAIPDVKTPKLDALEQQKKSESDLRKELDEFKKSVETREAEREKELKLARLNGDIESGISRLKSAGWTEDGIAGVRKVMEDKGILDPEIAAAYFERQHPPQVPVTPGGGGAWNFMEPPADTEQDLKRLIDTKGQSDQVTDKLAWSAINEIRQAGRR